MKSAQCREGRALQPTETVKPLIFGTVTGVRGEAAERAILRMLAAVRQDDVLLGMVEWSTPPKVDA